MKRGGALICVSSFRYDVVPGANVMIRVLFVCLGNICRSPMAEAVFLHQVRDAQLEGQIEVDSAGTGDWHIGDRPHAGTLEILKVNGIPEGSRARQVRLE